MPDATRIPGHPLSSFSDPTAIAPVWPVSRARSSYLRSTYAGKKCRRLRTGSLSRRAQANPQSRNCAGLTRASNTDMSLREDELPTGATNGQPVAAAETCPNLPADVQDAPLQPSVRRKIYPPAARVTSAAYAFRKRTYSKSTAIPPETVDCRVGRAENHVETLIPAIPAFGAGHRLYGTLWNGEKALET